MTPVTLIVLLALLLAALVTLPRRITAGWASPGIETATPFFRAELDEVSFR